MMAMANALNNGVARTPPRGWSNWNGFHNDFNASLMRGVADFLASSGLQAAGYEYITMGGIGYANNSQPGGNITRNATGYLQADPIKFPGGNAGVAALAQELRARGFKFGSYTEAGVAACNGAKGSSEGYERQDAALFIAEWGSEYLMVDSCGIIPEDGRSPAAQGKYELTLWQRLLNATAPPSRPVLLHDCHNGCASGYSGPTLAAAPCDADDGAQQWLLHTSISNLPVRAPKPSV